ncbi:MAG: Phosphoribosylaminoimidazole-succinocarboxamide synthase [Myxococcaceae bacterium]|nr:Phosphoribosylaminoimidazole-succinocarboxamide synthase [Myxococcaceae bacterium]
MTVSQDILREGLSKTLDGTDFKNLGIKYEGKVRDNYTTKDGHRILVVTDRISAFDRVLGTLPFKGQVLNALATWWFDETETIAPNHVLSVPDPNILIGEECEPLKVEMIVRAYVTGNTSTSLWTHYNKGARVFCGHRLPDGLKKHQKLDHAILTPSTKAEQGDHDVSVSREEIIASGAVSARDFDAAAEYALALFKHGQAVCAERGLIMVDTKYEFGRNKKGEIIVIDEIHTADSSRFWLADSYQAAFDAGEDPKSFDKDYVRRWMGTQGFTGDGPIPTIPDDVRVEAAWRYIQACDTIRGEAFLPDLQDPLPRIRQALGIEG